MNQRNNIYHCLVYLLMAWLFLEPIEAVYCITPIQKWSDLLFTFRNINEDTLVVIDVDWTLIMPQDKILKPNVEPSICSLMEKASQLSDGCSWDEEILSKLWQQRQIKLVDPLIPHFMRCIEEKAASAIALTALQTGPYGLIPKLEQWRYAELTTLGIDFTPHSPLDDPCIFENLPEGQSPLLLKGILFNNSLSKGEALVAFLEKINPWYRPKKVIFIDDHLPFLTSAAKSMSAHNICFHGFHLVHPKIQLTPVETEIALHQLTYFLKNEKWLSDREAQDMLHKSTKQAAKTKFPAQIARN